MHLKLSKKTSLEQNLFRTINSCNIQLQIRKIFYQKSQPYQIWLSTKGFHNKSTTSLCTKQVITSVYNQLYKNFTNIKNLKRIFREYSHTIQYLCSKELEHSGAEQDQEDFQKDSSNHRKTNKCSKEKFKFWPRNLSYAWT